MTPAQFREVVWARSRHKVTCLGVDPRVGTDATKLVIDVVNEIISEGVEVRYDHLRALPFIHLSDEHVPPDPRYTLNRLVIGDESSTYVDVVPEWKSGAMTEDIKEQPGLVNCYDCVHDMPEATMEIVVQGPWDEPKKQRWLYRCRDRDACLERINRDKRYSPAT